MPQNAWSLLIFTVFTQMSVGAFCMAELINLSYSKEFGFENLHPLRYSSRLFVFVAAFLAGVSAVFHLKNWAHAYYAFNNIRSSWVSREMALFSLFVASVALLALMSWRKAEARLLQRIIGIAGAFSGIVLIYAMAKIYMLPAIPTWDTWTTPGFFFTTLLVLGTVAIIGLYATKLTSSTSVSRMGDMRERWRIKTLPTLLKLLLVFMGIGIFITGFFAYRVMTVAEEQGTVAAGMSVEKQILFSLRIILYATGWALLFLSLKKTHPADDIQEKLNRLIFGASILITLAEILGRYLFFASFYRVGV